VPVEGWRFLKSWEKRAVPKLVAAGYEVRGDNAVRTRDRAMQLINLERDARQGGRFTINLAVGHEFARSFRDGKPLRMNGYEEAVFHARLGRLMEGKDLWWPYGDDEAAAEKFIEAISEVAIAYADAWFETIKDPGAAYILLKKGDLGRENLWNLALYADALGRRDEALEWLQRISGPPSHVEQLKKEWGA
jgi:hypothetical protein